MKHLLSIICFVIIFPSCINRENSYTDQETETKIVSGANFGKYSYMQKGEGVANMIYCLHTGSDSLSVFNLDNQSKKIYSLHLGQIHSFFINSSDSNYYFIKKDIGNNLICFDKDSIVKQITPQIDMPRVKGGVFYNSFSISSNTTYQPFYVINGTFLCANSVYYPSIVSKSTLQLLPEYEYLRDSIEPKVDYEDFEYLKQQRPFLLGAINADTILFNKAIGSIPDSYLNKVGMTYIPGGQKKSWSLGSENRKVFSYGASHELQCYDYDTLVTLVEAKSDYITDFDYVKYTDLVDTQLYQERLITQGYYQAIYYNRFKKEYYRIVVHPQDFYSDKSSGRKNEIFNRTFSILILNENFNKVDEVVFEKGTHDFRWIIPTKNGLMALKWGRKNEFTELIR